MTVMETIGLFWIVLGTGLFTAAMLIAAIWSIVLGLKVVVRRYKLGEAMERTLQEPEAQRRER
jgi:hypothetical protein